MIPRKFIVIGVVKLVVLAIAVGIVFSIYGCNTVRGIGQDIEKAGGLDAARLIEPLGMLNIRFAYGLGRGTNIAPSWSKLAA